MNEEAKSEQASTDGGPSGLGKVLAEIRDKAIAALLTAGGFATFVAVAGGAIVWARFYAAKLPPEQAVDALPETELIVVGAVSLAIFAFLGLLAMATVYLLDRGGRPTQPTTWGLTAVLVVEGVMACALTQKGTGRLAWAALVIVAVALVSVWVARQDRFRRLIDDLPAVEGERTAGAGQVAANPPPAETDDPHDAAAAAGPPPVQSPPPSPPSPPTPPAPPSPLPGREPPPRFKLTLVGRLVFLGLLASAAVAVCAIYSEWWPSVAILVAALLGRWNYFVAERSGSRFAWYGISVFSAVVIFGAVVAVLDVLDNPQVQPAALIRKGDGPAEGLQGIYVAENEKRVYLGSVATEGCGREKLRDDSGRLFWVPKDEVQAMVIGPLQNAPSASLEAPAMLRDLIATRIPQKAQSNPGQANAGQGSGADNGSTGAKDIAPGVEEEESQRPADTPPATSPTLAPASGLPPVDRPPAIREEPIVESITPQHAPPGSKVTVRGSGFGKRPRVSVGGVPATLDQNEKPATKRLVFRVPANAPSGPVIVACAERSRAPELVVQQVPVPAPLALPTKKEPRLFRLDARRSVDPDGQIVAYEWSADGSVFSNASSTEYLLEPERDKARVFLRVIDNEGLEATTTVELGADGSQLITFPADVLFCFDCRTLSRAGRNAVRALRRLAVGANLVRIDSHTDDRGSDRHNLRLSRARAHAIEQALTLGLEPPPAEISIKRFGARRPRASIDTEEGEALNRRLEILIRRGEPPVATSG